LLQAYNSYLALKGCFLQNLAIKANTPATKADFYCMVTIFGNLTLLPCSVAGAVIIATTLSNASTSLSTDYPRK
jgi:hypothetical protein